jgi:hypothetical protein
MFLSARLEINVQKWGTVRERQRDVKPADLLRARASLIRKLSGSGMAAAHAPRGVQPQEELHGGGGRCRRRRRRRTYHHCYIVSLEFEKFPADAAPVVHLTRTTRRCSKSLPNELETIAKSHHPVGYSFGARRRGKRRNFWIGLLPAV